MPVCMLYFHRPAHHEGQHEKKHCDIVLVNGNGVSLEKVKQIHVVFFAHKADNIHVDIACTSVFLHTSIFDLAYTERLSIIDKLESDVVSPMI
jgi:hypothetical protein